MAHVQPERPHGLLVHPIPRGQVLEAYRAVKVADRFDAFLKDSFQSHYEARLPPQPLEGQHTVIYMAVSLWKQEQLIVDLMRRYRKLGDYVARLELRHGFGLDYLDPAGERHPEHLTIWGTRENLAELVVNIVPIDAQ